MSFPRVSRRTETRVSPWVCLIAKDIEWEPSASPATYHCLAQADYIAVVARLSDGRLPIVRKYRAAVERETWELPGGLLAREESPLEAAGPELLGETGAAVVRIVDRGTAL